ncbi:reverse transcriptase domain-containing protein, partial [Tanacetum coccineum]
FEFDASNNEAEYEALVAGLRRGTKWGKEPGSQSRLPAIMRIKSMGRTNLKNKAMIQYLEKTKAQRLTLRNKKGTRNQESRQDSTTLSQRCSVQKIVFLEPWYGVLAQSRRIIWKVISMKDHAASTPARVGSSKSNQVWVLLAKQCIQMHGTSIKQNVTEYCQTHPSPQEIYNKKLTPITSPLSLYKWGIDISGPFLEAEGKAKFLIVAIDYFTKWIEAKPVATIKGNQVKKFA